MLRFRPRTAIGAAAILLAGPIALASAAQAAAEPLPAPTDLAAVHVSDTAAELNWSSSPFADRDVVERLVDQTWVEFSPGQRTYRALTGLTPGTTYTLRVYSTAGEYSGYADSPPTAAYSFTTLPGPDDVAPVRPGAPVASSITSTAANLFWAQTTDNVEVTGYYLDRLVDGSWTTVLTAGAFGNFQNVRQLTPATSHTFAVRAFDARGNVSERSVPVTFTTLPTVATLTCTVSSIPFAPGFLTQVSVRNNTTAPAGWRVTFTLPAAATVTNTFGGVVGRAGDQATISPSPYQPTLAPGFTASPGFIGSYVGSSAPFQLPTGFAVNGVPCTS